MLQRAKQLDTLTLNISLTLNPTLNLTLALGAVHKRRPLLREEGGGHQKHDIFGHDLVGGGVQKFRTSVFARFYQAGKIFLT